MNRRPFLLNIYQQESCSGNHYLQIHLDGNAIKLIDMNYTEPVIHVGILSAEEIEFVLNGTFIALSGKDYKGKQKAKYVDGKVLFDGKSHDELILEPIGEDTSFDLINVIIGIDFHWERKEDQRFKGALKIIVEDKNITAINRIKVEDYLTSVISSEMSATASDELLKAHAVISRSWLLSNSPLNQHPLNFPNGDLKTASLQQTKIQSTLTLKALHLEELGRL